MFVRLPELGAAPKIFLGVNISRGLRRIPRILPCTISVSKVIKQASRDASRLVENRMRERESTESRF